MGMAAIVFNGAEPFEQTVKTLSTEGPMWNLVKIAQSVSEKEMFKHYTFLYMYIAWARADNPPGDKILIVTKKF